MWIQLKNNGNKSNTTTPVGFTSNNIQSDNTLKSMDNLSISTRALMSRANKTSKVSFGSLGEKESELISASERGDLERVHQLLHDKTIDVNAADDDGNTALMKAAKKGDWEVVGMLSRHTNSEGFYVVNVNRVDRNGETALMKASKNGHIGAVHSLLSNEDIHVNAADRNGETALMKAAKNGFTEIVQALLEHKNTYEILGYVDGIPKIIDSTDDYDIDVNAADKDGKTALMWAAKEGRTDVVNALLNHIDTEGNYDVNINLVDNYGHTPLMWAAYYGHTEIVNALLQREDINVNVVGEDGNLALTLAYTSKNINIAEMILKRSSMDENQKSLARIMGLVLSKLS